MSLNENSARDCFQPLSGEEGKGKKEGKGRVIQGWKREVKNETGRVHAGKGDGEINLDVGQSERFRMRRLQCLAAENWWAGGGKMGQSILFFFCWKATKIHRQKQKRKHEGGLWGGDAGPFARKMCVSVSTLIRKSVFPRVLYSIVAHQLTEQKITCETSKAFQHLTSHKAARRPLAATACLSTQPLWRLWVQRR